jgi:hypothetical protein
MQAHSELILKASHLTVPIMFRLILPLPVWFCIIIYPRSGDWRILRDPLIIATNVIPTPVSQTRSRSRNIHNPVQQINKWSENLVIIHRWTSNFQLYRTFCSNLAQIFLKGHCHKKVNQKSILGDALDLKFEPLICLKFWVSSLKKWPAGTSSFGAFFHVYLCRAVPLKGLFNEN